MNYVKNLRKMIGHEPVILTGSVVIMIDDMGRVLLQQRKATSYGTWGLPGGLMELKESTEETARREVFEESGLTLGKLNLLEVISGSNCYIEVENGDAFYSVTIVYFTDEISGELIIDKEESLDMKFFEFNELPDLIVASHRKAINTYMNEYVSE